jgi:hypothetical protein
VTVEAVEAVVTVRAVEALVSVDLVAVETVKAVATSR